MKTRKRKMTFYIFRNDFHQETGTTTFKDPSTDPFESCKNLKDVRDVFLTKERETLASLFEDMDDMPVDFILAKINKRNLSNFICFYKKDLYNSTRFMGDR